MTDWENGVGPGEGDDAEQQELAREDGAAGDAAGEAVAAAVTDAELQDIAATLEALMFASTEPLSLEEMRVALPGAAAPTIESALDALARGLDRPGRGMKIEKVAGGWRLVTRPELAGPLRTLFRFRNQKRLTPAALDVLAIVAYSQPITAPEIQEIRGTDPSYALRTLMERQLVRMVGRKRVVGRPILYGTTREFLLHFGLDSLEDLPPVEGFGTQVVAQGNLFPPGEFEPLGDGPLDIDAELPAAEPDAEVPAAAEPHAERPAAADPDAEPPAAADPDAGVPPAAEGADDPPPAVREPADDDAEPRDLAAAPPRED